jgi:hypothetical protein
MSLLVSNGVLSYGGFVLPPETETISISQTPIPDEAKRTLRSIKYTLSVRTKITNAFATDATIANLRSNLQAPGLPLVVTGRGFGLMQVNTTLSNLDVAFGPWPEVIEFTPIALPRAWEVVWRVTVEIPQCVNTSSNMLEWNYKLTFNNDKAGYSTRTYDYHILIANNIGGADRRTLIDSPDNYVTRVIPPPIQGFGREWGPRTLNLAKTRVEGSVTDTEMGVNYPAPGVAEWDFDHTISASRPGLTNWSGHLNAWYILAKDCPNKWTPSNHFFGELLDDRINATRAALDSNPDAQPDNNVGINPGQDLKQALIPTQITITEPRGASKERRYEFSVSYTFVCSARAILSCCSMWRPVPDSDWNLWALSLVNSAFNAFGAAALAFTIGDDKVIDSCGGTPTPPGANPPPDVANNGVYDALQQFMDSVLSSITPSNSWVDYRNGYEILAADGTSVLRTLPAGPADVQGATLGSPGSSAGIGEFNAGNGLPQNADVGGFAFPPAANAAAANANLPQRRTRPQFWVVMYGQAMRAVYQISCPALVAIGQGTIITPANDPDKGDHFSQDCVAGDPTVYRADWRLRYVVTPGPGVAKPVALPPNPLLGG